VVGKDAAFKKMNEKNSDFLPKATDRLVSAGLTLALGSNIAKEPAAFNKMKEAIQHKIMTNPEYRKKLEKLVSILEKFDKFENENE
jgi:hypothetical protein